MSPTIELSSVAVSASPSKDDPTAAMIASEGSIRLASEGRAEILLVDCAFLWFAHELIVALGRVTNGESAAEVHDFYGEYSGLVRRGDDGVQIVANGGEVFVALADVHGFAVRLVEACFAATESAASGTMGEPGYAALRLILDEGVRIVAAGTAAMVERDRRE